jgi:hypothetical protein
VPVDEVLRSAKIASEGTQLLVELSVCNNALALNDDVAYLRIVSIPTTSNPPNSYAFRNR